MNVPALISLLRVARDPRLSLPHHTVPTFAQLPVPLSKAFQSYQRQHGSEKEIDIRAVVLDKDNCFAAPGEDTVHASCQETFNRLLQTYPPSSLLIVSNSSGLTSSRADPTGIRASALEQNTGVKVLRHAARKPSPACVQEIMAHFEGVVDSPSQIAVVGDRLFTDAVMANGMGAWAVWIKEGVVKDRGVVTRIEYALSDWLLKRGYRAPQP